MTAIRSLAAAALMLLLQACIVVPQTREFYDANCQVLTKEIVLETAVIGQFRGCGGDACLGMLIAP